MQELKVIGVENGALLAADEDGDRYRIPIDDVLQSHVKKHRSDPADSAKASPREIQAHIRQGLSAEEVSDITGASLDYVKRFEGPIIAEREHIVSAALGVPVHTGADVDPLAEPATFGSAIRDRLSSLHASGERWASWKDEEEGWLVKLSFTSDGIDHDARWKYDQRKNALAPANSEAVTLSQQGELQGSLIPRLRAVTSTTPDESRFDSAAFTFLDEHDRDNAMRAERPEAPATVRPPTTTTNSIPVTAIKRSEEESPKGGGHQTADLLEALRKRRGERESTHAKPAASHPSPELRIEGDLEPSGTPSANHPASQAAALPTRGRKGRAAMPSWDEIVFGAKKDDDPA